ncbi:MAG: hypothetical protein QNK31_03420 [Porticoccus sp.]|nr:hypothetical protein [Porticoccus sp.]
MVVIPSATITEGYASNFYQQKCNSYSFSPQQLATMVDYQAFLRLAQKVLGHNSEDEYSTNL